MAKKKGKKNNMWQDVQYPFCYTQKALKGFDFYIPDEHFLPPFSDLNEARFGEMEVLPRCEHNKRKKVDGVRVTLTLEKEVLDALRVKAFDLKTWDMNKVFKYLMENEK